MKDEQFKKFMEEQKKQTALLNRILEENVKANARFDEYAKDSHKELREIKIRLVDNLNKL